MIATSDTVIRADGLWKQYRIGAKQTRYRTLRESLGGAMLSPWRRAKAVLRGEAAQGGDETFWALRDVAFEIKRGEIVGVIGRNGAGKSTLLKILSRITEPSRGELRMRGRVGALLEVGTGFHPELSGRDNVFLNGAILGMRRQEIAKKFDAIVAFAEVDQFIDTPVKHYSSGMYMRLAFGIAAHLDPEILIVDEVLAVGDLAFQRKCLGKMEEVAKQDRTVLLVSHNMSVVRTLCTRGIVLDAGRVTIDATAAEACAAYAGSFNSASSVEKDGLTNRKGRTSGAVRFARFRMVDDAGRDRVNFRPGETVRMQLSVKAYADVPDLGFYIAINSGVTNEVVTSIKDTLATTEIKAGSEFAFEIALPDVHLRPGDYRLYLCLGDKTCSKFYDVIDENVSLPYLSVVSDEKDFHKLAGYVSLPWAVHFQRTN
jgi:lipopolysaccharide transport system ATP-binding protein